MKLAQIQNKFQDHITRTDTQIDADFAALYQTGNIPLDIRLKVYRDNIIGGLTDMLRGVFPALEALTGEAFTKTLLQSYIRQNLPQSGCLDEYGHDLADFIASYKPASALPYLPDCTRLEWALSTCEHAADDDALRPDDLAARLKEENFSLTLRTSASLLASDFPVWSIRAYALDPNHADHPPPTLTNNPEYILIHRPILRTESKCITPAEYTLLTHLQTQIPLTGALETVLKFYPDLDFQAFLQKFLMMGVFQRS